MARRHKASCTKWSSALMEMGFDKEQIHAALGECKSLRQCIERLCHETAQASFAEAIASLPASAPSPLAAAPSEAVDGARPLLRAISSEPEGPAPKAQKMAANLNPLWIAMCQRFNENVSALRNRQGRASLGSRRRSIRPGRLSLSQAPVKKARRAEPPPPPESVATEGTARDVEMYAASCAARPASEQSEDIAIKDAASPASRWSAGGALANAAITLAGLPTPSRRSEPLRFLCCNYVRKRLFRKTRQPDPPHCRQCKPRRLSGKQPRPRNVWRDSVWQKIKEKCIGKQVKLLRGRSRLENRPRRSLKSYRVTWAWKLADMGFPDRRIEAAIEHCSTQREAVEWLCSSPCDD